MTATHLKWIAIVVGALLLIWGGARLLPSGTDRLAGGLQLPNVPADSADSVIVTTPDDTIIVTRSDVGSWAANGFAASSTAVAQFFAALAAPTPPELVAQHSASFTRLGLDSAAAHRVRIVGAHGTLLDLLVSSQGPDFQSAYVRAPGDSSAYAVRGGLAGGARRRLDDWRDKTVAAVAPDSIREVELRRGRQRTLLQRHDETWSLAGGRAVDSAAVQRLLERYRRVTATGFPTTAQRDSAFRSTPERSVNLRDASGATLLHLEFDSTANGFWVRRRAGAGAPVYRVASWDADGLVPAESLLVRRAR